MAMHSNYYINLDIDVTDALRNDLDLEDFRKTGNNTWAPIDIWHLTKKNLIDVYNKEWLERMRSLSLEVEGSLIFYRAPNLFHKKLHIDVEVNPVRIVQYGVNFVYDENDDSQMIWYELNSPESLEERINWTAAGVPYCSWDLEEFDGNEVSRKTIGRRLVLVNTSVPHTVETFDKERWSFSLRMSDMANINWRDTLTKFRNFIPQ